MSFITQRSRRYAALLGYALQDAIGSLQAHLSDFTDYLEETSASDEQTTNKTKPKGKAVAGSKGKRRR